MFGKLKKKKKKSSERKKELGTRRKSEKAWRFGKLDKRSVSFHSPE